MKVNKGWGYGALWGVLILMVAYFFDFQGHLAARKAVIQKIAALNVARAERLAIAKKKRPISNLKIVRAESATASEPLFLLIHESGLQVLSAKWISPEKMKDSLTETISVTLLGDFYHIKMFVKQLGRQSPAILLSDFSYQQNDHHQYIFTAILTRFKISMQNEPSQVQAVDVITTNPFCKEEAPIVLSEREVNRLLHETPLRQIRLVGLATMGQMQRALFSLPSHVFIDQAVGDVLSKEGARIIEMKRDAVVLRLPNHQRLLMPVLT